MLSIGIGQQLSMLNAETVPHEDKHKAHFKPVVVSCVHSVLLVIILLLAGCCTSVTAICLLSELLHLLLTQALCHLNLLTCLPVPCCSCLQHLLKDLRLFKDEAGKAGLDTQLPAALEAITQAACERGLENADYSAVYAAVAHPEAHKQ